MKARYLDLPVEKLPHEIKRPELWPYRRGRSITVLGFAEGVIRFCGTPKIAVSGVIPNPGYSRVTTCIHMIELDESALDAEVEQIAKGIPLEAAK